MCFRNNYKEEEEEKKKKIGLCIFFYLTIKRPDNKLLVMVQDCYGRGLKECYHDIYH